MPALREQRRARAAGDVGAETDPHAGLDRGASREGALGEVHVRQRAVCDAGAALRDQRPVGVVEMGGVSQHGVFAHQPEPIEGVRVGDTASFEYVAVLPIAFRAVGLDQGVGVGCERGETGERLVGAGRDEPGRDDRLHEL